MGRMRGFIWLTTGLLVALTAGFVTFATLRKAQSAAPAERAPAISDVTVPVVVAVTDVPVRSLLTDVELTVKEMPVAMAPPGYVSEIGQVANQVTLVDLYAGEVVLPQRLMDPDIIGADGRTALILEEGQVLMAFPASDVMSRVGVLKPGDQVDLLFSLLDVPTSLDPAASVVQPSEGVVTDDSSNEKQVTLNLLQNLTISAVVGGVTQTDDGGTSVPVGEPAILLTVSPQDALILKYVKDAGGLMDIVLRAPGADEPFESEPVDMEYIINRYEIPLD